MEERYNPRKIRNLRDLHSEQARVQEEYEHMEDNWMTAFTSLEALAPLLLRIIPFGKNSNQNTKAKKKDTSKGKRRPQATVTQPLSEQHRRGKRKSYKKLGKTLLIWQAASLSAFVIGNIALHYFRRKKRK